MTGGGGRIGSCTTGAITGSTSGSTAITTGAGVEISSSFAVGIASTTLTGLDRVTGMKIGCLAIIGEEIGGGRTREGETDSTMATSTSSAGAVGGIKIGTRSTTGGRAKITGGGVGILWISIGAGTDLTTGNTTGEGGEGGRSNSTSKVNGIGIGADSTGEMGSSKITSFLGETFGGVTGLKIGIVGVDDRFDDADEPKEEEGVREEGNLNPNPK